MGAHGVANNLIQLIDAAEKLQNTNIVFQLIGSGMKKVPAKEVLKRNLNNVIFREPVSKSEVFKYILSSNVDTSVLKNIETFKETIYSNKTFDYMSCKKPILLIIDVISRELIENSKCGILQNQRIYQIL